MTTESKVEKMKLAIQLAEALVSRKKVQDDIINDFTCLDDRDGTQALEQRQELDNQIAPLLQHIHKVFPNLSSYSISETVVIIYAYASIYYDHIPSIDSQDLFAIVLRGSAEALMEVLESFKDGRLHQLFSISERYNTIPPYRIVIRSFSLFEQIVLADA